MNASSIEPRIARLLQLRRGFAEELGPDRDRFIAIDRKDYANALRDAIEAVDAARAVLERATKRPRDDVG